MKDLSFINALPPAQRNALLNGPTIKPPPGIESNFAHPPNRNELGYGVVIFTGVFCTLLVVLRLYSRVFYHKKVVFEDGQLAINILD
jgi:hypothetical protein